jgi:hypothetical protein
VQGHLHLHEFRVIFGWCLMKAGIQTGKNFLEIERETPMVRLGKSPGLPAGVSAAISTRSQRPPMAPGTPRPTRQMMCAVPVKQLECSWPFREIP